MDRYPVYATAAVLLILVGSQVCRRSFDAFAPIWLFLAGFAQVYVVQAISYREYALRVRGEELVTQANFRALWALLWFLLVYYCGLPRRVAARLPGPPRGWSPALVAVTAPTMIAWGLVCAGLALHGGPVGDEEFLLRQFPIWMIAGGVMLVVTGRQPDRPMPLLTAAGLLTCAGYVFIWMFNGRRSHAVIGVLAGVCSYYLPRWRRPSLPILAATGFACALAVSLALGWRGNARYELSASGFLQYLGDFDASNVLVNLNLKERHEVDAFEPEQKSKETEEYGGFLLMMFAVPELSEYDYGASYLRLFTTYIPRLVWPSKPLPGRDQWVNAWIAGSEFKRDGHFTGPAIGVLGATQLNGGAVATAIVLAVLALLMRTAYDFFRFHSDTPWAQVWWPLTFYNAWLMTVNDDPFVWFYYIYGHTTLPPMVFLWFATKFLAPDRAGHDGV